MDNPVHQNPELIFSPGTQVVTLVDLLDSQGKLRYPPGTVGKVVQSPLDLEHSYRVAFPDGRELSVKPRELAMLALYKQTLIGRDSNPEAPETHAFADRVIYRCIIGSRAYGLNTEESDVDQRGVYLPTAEQHWSLFGVPEQVEVSSTQEQYWEFQKFLILALKANPNILECLYTPLVVHATDLGKELRESRAAFLSRLVYQTFNGYVLSQFKKMQADLRNQGKVKWKHVMHLIRLLKSGIHLLTEGDLQVEVGPDRDLLLAIRKGEIAWEICETLRLNLHREFEQAFAQSRLPERPDFVRAQQLLLRARRLALEEKLP